MEKYFDENGNEVTLESLQIGADASDMKLSEYMQDFGYTFSEGKTNGSTETPPIEPVNNTAAGDSSSADISLESPNFDPYLLTLEDLEGEEDEVQARIQEKMQAIGIDTDQTGWGDAIQLSSKERDSMGHNFRESASLKDRAEAMQKLNTFITQYGNTEYANSMKEGREDILAGYYDATAPIEITVEEYKESEVDRKIREWNSKETVPIGGGGSGTPGVSMGPTTKKLDKAKESSFDSPEDYKEYLDWKESGIVEVSDAEAAKGIETAVYEDKLRRGQKYVDNLSDEDKEAVSAIVSKEKIDIVVRANNLETEAVALNKASEDLNYKIEEFNANPTNQEDLIALQREAVTVQAAANEYNSFVESLSDPSTQDLMLAVDNFNKDYSLFNKLGADFKSAAAQMGYAGAQVITFLTTPYNVSLAGEMDKLDEVWRPTLERGRREGQMFATAPTLDQVKDLDDLLDWTLSTATAAIPSLSMAFTGPAAMPLFFLSGYGGKASELALAEYDASTRLLENAKLLEDPNNGLGPVDIARIEAEMQADSEIINLPEWRKLGVAALAGTAEVFFERVGTMAILAGAGKAVNPTTLVSAGEKFLRAANQEGMSEAGTQIANNYGNYVFLGEELNLFEGIGEAYAGGALIGGPLSLKTTAPAIYEYAVSTLMDKRTRLDIQAKLVQLSELTGIDGLQNVLDPNTDLSMLPLEVKRLVDEVTAEIGVLKDGIANRVGGDLTNQQVMEVGALSIEMQQINKRFVELAAKGVSGSALAAAEKTLRKQFDAVSEKREAILTSSETSTAATEYNAGLKVDMNAKAGYQMMLSRSAAMRKAESAQQFNGIDPAKKSAYLSAAKAGKPNLSNEQVLALAQQNYFKEQSLEAMKADKLAAEAFIQASGSNATIEEVNEAEWARRKLGDGEASITGDKIIINTDRAAENGRTAVYSHEVLHSIVSQKINDGDANKAGENLLEFLEQNSPDTYTFVKARLDVAYEGSAQYYEEAMNALSDYIAEGNTVELSTLSQLQKFVNDLIGKKSGVEIDDALSTYSFIATYANKNNTPKTRGILERLVNNTKKEDEEEAPTKESRSASANRAKAALDGIQASGVIDPFSPAILNELDGMIGAQVQPYINKGLELDREELLQEVTVRLFEANDIGKFDGRGSLYGYLNGRIKFRILDAFKQNPSIVTDYGGVDVDGLQGEEVQRVAVEAIEEPSKVTVDADKYKSLTRRRVVSKESMVVIKNKLKPIVRTLKTRMDQVVSKNVTVKPWVKELKITVGKQFDIILKKEMGGKKDGELRKWLLKNKAGVLENMTTTWLMTAMPNAIQKKVNGQWTSDWKGKKIDRETVDTDKSGRTSGAELVRRMPNVATRLSDADYLSNILDSKGNPIRGRKESLAKAVAEELALEVFFEQVNDPNSELREALNQNQEGLGAVVSESVVAEVTRDLERGNVKYSFSTFSDSQWKAWYAKNGKLSDQITDMNGRYTEKGLKLVINRVFEDDLDAKQIEGLSKLFFKLLKPLEGEDVVAKFKSVETSFREWLGEVAESKDFEETIVTITGASASVVELFRNINNVAGARSIVISELIKMDPEVVMSFAPGTFANSGKIGEYRPGTNEKGTHRSDLFINKADLVAELKAAKPSVDWDNVKAKYTATANVTKGHINGTFNTAQDKANATAAWEMLTTLMKDLATASPDMQAMIMATMNSGTNTVLRVAAPVTHRAEVMKGTKSTDYRYEHVLPARVVLSFLYQRYVRKDRSIDVEALKSDYKVAIIPVDMDKVVGKTGFSKRAVAGYTPGVTPWFSRYYNAFTLGKIQQALVSYETGDVIGENFAKAYKDKVTIDEAAYDKAVQELDAPVTKSSKSADENLSKEFNNILERKTGVESYKTYSEVQAKMRGAKKGKFKFFIAPGADDFRGLVNYAFAGKGKQGETDMRFFEEKLLNPYFKGIAAIESARQAIRRDYTTVKKLFKPEHKMMEKKIGNSQFTYDQAVRVYLWEKQGTEIPGVSKRDLQLLRDAINKNPELKAYADAMLVVSKRTEWIEPSDYWTSQTILSDLNSMTEKIGRKKYLEEFIETSDAIFTDENLNKIEALYGSDHRAALEDSLYAMKNGSNRPFGKNKQVNKWLNWINGSTGAIMFFNRRSALLQMLSFTNFTNWTDNNPLKQAAAFANQKQYWSDFAMIFNSDKLKERRSGLKTDVSESEIANAVANGKNSPNAALNYILKLGFTPTQIADSFAIATGGAMFYRNRVNSYLKEGMSKKEAEDKAFLDFSKRSDEAQQSSDPALVSQQQRSVLGRLILAFANTPMQYTRLMKKAGQDLINGRGSFKENVSKIAYYGIVQNFIFSSLQSALFALAFDDEDEEGLSDAEIAKKEEYETSRVTRVLNGMMDTVLRGSGVYGAVASVVKNTILEYRKQEAKGFMGEDAAWLLQILNLSPPIGSKVRKIYSAARTRRFEKDTIAERGWALTADGRLNLGPNYSVLGSLVSGIANVPLDRIVDELRSVTEALDERNKAWQRIALAFGWKTWDVGALNEEGDLIKAEAKVKRKEAGKEKAKAKRASSKKDNSREARLARAEKRRNQ